MDELLQALKNLVEHGRPSFPRTPYRKALDEAMALIAKAETTPDPIKKLAEDILYIGQDDFHWTVENALRLAEMITGKEAK